jgi:hypothetical protein
VRRPLAVAAAVLGLAPSAALGAWSFTDVTEAAGLSVAHVDLGPAYDLVRFKTGGAAAGDYDGDGWLDLYLIGGDAGRNYLFRNRGDGTFEERAEAAGVALAGVRDGAGPSFVDFDGDGRLDLLVLGVYGTQPSLFRNLGDGTFADVSGRAGLRMRPTTHTFSATFGDYDRDGDLDIFLTHWFTDMPASAEYLWRNDGDGTFTDVSAAARIPVFVNPHLPPHLFPPNLCMSQAAAFADIDGDGWPDLLVASDYETTRVLRNARDGTFADATTADISDQNGTGLAVGDYDGDGDLDWFVTGIFDGLFLTGNRLYRNRGDGTFDDVTTAAGVRNGEWGYAATFADLDNDGHLDIFHTNGWEVIQPRYHDDPTRLFVANGDGTFTERALELGIVDWDQGRGVIAFDYDRDGDLDLLVANNHGPYRLFRNDGGNERSHLTVRLRGRAPNTEAIGARVYVTAAGRTQMREVRAGNSYESADPAEAHFGLGAAAAVDEVRVVWPDQRVSVVGRVAARRLLVLEETRDPVPTTTTTSTTTSTSTTSTSTPAAVPARVTVRARRAGRAARIVVTCAHMPEARGRGACAAVGFVGEVAVTRTARGSFTRRRRARLVLRLNRDGRRLLGQEPELPITTVVTVTGPSGGGTMAQTIVLRRQRVPLRR